LHPLFPLLKANPRQGKRGSRSKVSGRDKDNKVAVKEVGAVAVNRLALPNPLHAGPMAVHG
jgi:hypothetical protein